MTEPLGRRELILGAVEDLVADFLYYDRKEDEDLPRGAIEAAVQASDPSYHEIVGQFAKSLHEGLI